MPKKQTKSKKLGYSHEPRERRAEKLPPFVKPTDTSRVDAVVHLAGMMGGNSSNYIEGMERDGQRQLAKSATTIPSRLNGNTEEELRQLGFELGPMPRSGDTLFRPALFPKGWKVVPTSHPMWSDIVDAQGFVRASMFYKAAFYDRDAFLRLTHRFFLDDDYAQRDADGSLITHVMAVMPGHDSEGVRNSKIVHTVRGPEKFPDHRDARGHDHPYFLARDKVHADARAWLKTTYPLHDEPVPYWDVQF